MAAARQKRMKKGAAFGRFKHSLSRGTVSASRGKHRQPRSTSAPDSRKGGSMVRRNTPVGMS